MGRISKIVRFAVKVGPIIYPIAKEILQKRKTNNQYKGNRNSKKTLR